tara:strand:+ start:1183 stop:1677 length:495 start_codon:yes stop_codon:yes gene_type:complete
MKMTLTDLTNKENELYLFVIDLYNGKVNKNPKSLTLEKVYAEYKNVHTEYAKMSNKDIESLKRGLFIQWYSITEPNYLTGIAELDKKSELKIITELKNRIDKNKADNELKWMLNHYLEWDFVFERFKNIAEFKKDKKVIELTNIKLKVVNRGQMGIYWNSIIEK